MPFLIIFVLIPIAEVYAFIAVGQEVGIFKTLLLCVLTAIIGGYLVRLQGLETIFKAQKAIKSGSLPLNAFFDGLCLVIAGALLLTPGFVTDTLGFLLLIPPIREFLRRLVVKSGKFTVQSEGFTSKSSPNDNNIIEGEYKVISNDDKKHDK